MDTVVGLVGWVLIIWAIRAWRRTRRRQPPSPPGRPRPAAGAAARRRTSRDRAEAGPIAGWLIGHEIAHGHQGFPGDPLPGGHLGSPANLAFWGGMLADEDEDEDEHGW